MLGRRKFTRQLSQCWKGNNIPMDIRNPMPESVPAKQRKPMDDSAPRVRRNPVLAERTTIIKGIRLGLVYHDVQKSRVSSVSTKRRSPMVVSVPTN